MIKRRILVALLTVCLTITSCISFVPQAWAETAEPGIGSDQPAAPELPGDSDTPEPDQPAAPEDPGIQEPDVPDRFIINDWDENGFYHGADGAIMTGCILLIGELMYEFDKNGKSALYEGDMNGEDGLNYYYKEGLKFTGTRSLDGKLYYYKDGLKFTGVRVVKGTPYYYKNGSRTVNTAYIYLKKLYKNGKVYTGIYKSFYYDKGVKVTKYKNKVKKVSNGKIYYFKKNSSVYTGTGWIRVNGKRYYLKKGAAYTGWHYIGNYKYYFHKSNASLCQDLIACQGSKWKTKKLLIKVNRKKNVVTIYAKDGKKGYTIPVKALICSVGKKSTPTIKGTYTMEAGAGKTYRWHILGGPALGVDYSYGQYCVRIYKSWLFHSVTYSKPDKYSLLTDTYNDLGSAASRGCIRLQVKDAKLIYDIVKYRDTTVKILDSDWTGPFDKPVIKKIPSGQKYDPTDLNVKK